MELCDEYVFRVRGRFGITTLVVDTFRLCTRRVRCYYIIDISRFSVVTDFCSSFFTLVFSPFVSVLVLVFHSTSSSNYIPTFLFVFFFATTDPKVGQIDINKILWTQIIALQELVVFWHACARNWTKARDRMQKKNGMATRRGVLVVPPKLSREIRTYNKSMFGLCTQLNPNRLDGFS